MRSQEGVSSGASPSSPQSMLIFCVGGGISSFAKYSPSMVMFWQVVLVGKFRSSVLSEHERLISVVLCVWISMF